MLLILFGVLFLLHNKGYCAQEDSEYTTDTTYFILEEYQGLINQFVKVFNMSYQGEVQSWSNNIDDFLNDIKSGKYPYFYKQNDQYIRIFMYDHNTSKTLIDTSLIYNDNFRVPSTAYNITNAANQKFYVMNTQSGGFTYNDSMGAINVTIPQIIWGRIPIEVVECMSSAGLGYQDNQDILDLKTLINQVKNKIDSTNERLDGVQDTLDSFIDSNQDTSDITSVDTSASTSITSGEDYQQVESSYNNVWSNFISTINSMNESNPESIVIPLPYVNKTMLVSSNIVSNRIPQSIKSIITMFWWFVFGRHIILLWKRIFEYFASGSILNEESNSSGVLGFRNILKNYVDTINPFMM